MHESDAEVGMAPQLPEDHFPNLMQDLSEM